MLTVAIAITARAIKDVNSTSRPSCSRIAMRISIESEIEVQVAIRPLEQESLVHGCQHLEERFVAKTVASGELPYY